VTIVKTSQTYLRLFLAVAVLILGVTLYYGAPPAYNWLKQERFMALSKSALAESRLENAQLWAFEALKRNPERLAANRLVIQVFEAQGHPMTVFWHSRLIQLQKNPPSKDYLAWAASALRYGQVKTAQHALDLIPEPERKVEYCSLSAGVALALGDKKRADVFFVQAARWEPGRPIHEINLAALRLDVHDPALAQEARMRLEKLSGDPQDGLAALRALAKDASQRRDFPAYLRLSREILKRAPGGWEDRLQELDASESEVSVESATLAELKTLAVQNPLHVASLASWMIAHGRAQECLLWLDGQNENLRNLFPVQMSRCDVLWSLGDFAGMEEFLQRIEWRKLDTLRLALLAKVSRQQGSPDFKERWETAVKSTTSMDGMALLLGQWVLKWGWESEASGLFWTVARAKTSERSQALQLLLETAYWQGKALNVYQVVSEQLSDNPQNTVYQNNHTYLSLLLNINRASAIRNAEDLQERYPSNPIVRNTYALACYFSGKHVEALELLNKWPEPEDQPSLAFKWALLLASGGQQELSSVYRKKAAQARLMDEERRLLDSLP